MPHKLQNNLSSPSTKVKYYTSKMLAKMPPKITIKPFPQCAIPHENQSQLLRSIVDIATTLSLNNFNSLANSSKIILAII